MSTAGAWILSAYLVMVGGLVVAGVRTGWQVWVQRTLAASLIPAGVAVVFYVGLVLTSSEPEPGVEAVGVLADPTRKQLRNLSDVLVAADKKGDAALAQNVILAVGPILAKLNEQPGTKQMGAPLYNCRLAAMHLFNAAIAVETGARWLSDDQFQTAAAACRD